ncbi:MAG TPA: L-rhamnose/proton symporter RhaT [Terriglobia bacterium]|nr:L-rhamnose/proton symporter RhaT [Terriglobia bacterium]
MTSAWIGFSLVVIGGIMQGTYFLGLKYVNPWKWENIWALYSLLSLIVLPVALALATVPHLSEMLRRAPASALAWVFLYGAGWGVGSVLAGLGVAKMGMAMGVSVLIGVTAAIGTAVPLVVDTPQLIFSARGVLVILAVAALLIGVALAAVAGKKREASLADTPAVVEKGAFGVGLAICVFSGIFSAMLNLAFAFSQPVVYAGMETGASNFGALNAVWMVALGGGFIANAGYTSYLLTRNKTWSNFTLSGTAKAWAIGLGMAVLWTGGIILYGRGAAFMGQTGAVVGWPLFIGIIIFVSTIWGFASGEWKDSSQEARYYMVAGMAVLLIASGLVGLANHL